LRKDCESALREELEGDRFKPAECKEFGDTCYTITGNEVETKGYRAGYHLFHCVPMKLWLSLDAKANDTCYTQEPMCEGEDGEICEPAKEKPCPEYITSLDKDIFKSGYGKIQKCPDYKRNSAFVCEK
jgi:hypothetical protein